MQTAVVDENGEPLVVYHGTQCRFEGFDPGRMNKDGAHFGGLAQAVMRAGSKGDLVSAVLEIHRIRRSRDRGGNWRKVIAAAKKAGYDGIVYLNRYEGIDRATVLRGIEEGVDLDKLTDSQFRRFAPEMTDAYIVFYPEQITVMEVVPAKS